MPEGPGDTRPFMHRIRGAWALRALDSHPTSVLRREPDRADLAPGCGRWATLVGVTASAHLDQTLADAVDAARAAAEQEAAGLVGDHVGVDGEDERLATHLFATLDPAYRGWRWAVTLTRAPR